MAGARELAWHGNVWMHSALFNSFLMLFVYGLSESAILFAKNKRAVRV